MKDLMIGLAISELLASSPYSNGTMPTLFHRTEEIPKEVRCRICGVIYFSKKPTCSAQCFKSWSDKQKGAALLERMK